MSIEKTLTDLIGPLCSNQIYWDTLPEGYKVTGPVVIAQQVGGESEWFVENAMPSHMHARIQIVVWSTRRTTSNALARLIEKTLCEAALVGQPYGAFVAIYEEAMKLFGTRQQFGFWYPDP